MSASPSAGSGSVPWRSHEVEGMRLLRNLADRGGVRGREAADGARPLIGYNGFKMRAGQGHAGTGPERTRQLGAGTGALYRAGELP